MSSIKFNQVTKEIEITGSESFIEANFHMIQSLMIEDRGPGVRKVSNKDKVNNRATSLNTPKISKTTGAIEIPNVSECSDTLSATELEIPASRQEQKIKRPPIRKYFDQTGKLLRSEDKSIGENPSIINIVKPAAGPVSDGFFISSLKQNLGLSKDRIEGIIRDAEREGRVKRNPDGSYEWL